MGLRTSAEVLRYRGTEVRYNTAPPWELADLGVRLHILKLRWMSPFETKMKTDIPRFQHVDFGCFDPFGMILATYPVAALDVTIRNPNQN